MKEHSYVSLYSGCGGLDYGFHKLKFKLLFANDFHQDSCKSFENFYNFKPSDGMPIARQCRTQ